MQWYFTTRQVFLVGGNNIHEFEGTEDTVMQQSNEEIKFKYVPKYFK